MKLQKRMCLYLVSIISLFVIFNGCKKSEQGNMLKQSENKIENRLIKAIPSESIDIKSMTKLDEFSYDLDLDNSEEKIGLYTAARRNEKGEMMWDDGQNWSLVVWNEKNAYVLFSGYVQLGSVYFTVSNNRVGEISNINVIEYTGSSFSLMTYAFNKDRGGFEGRSVYNSMDTNFVHNSIPSY